MASTQPDRRNLLEKIRDRLVARPDLYDVKFYVGPDKVKIKGLRLLLEAASVGFIKQFLVFLDPKAPKKGIPLPDYDVQAFKLFIELTMLDAWNADELKKRRLTLGQILDLKTIASHYAMEIADEHLEDLLIEALKMFRNNQEIVEFMQLSKHQLQLILDRDYLPLTEKEIFHRVIKWAEVQLNEKNKKRTPENVRIVVGDCFFQIRFPLLTEQEFDEISQNHVEFKPNEVTQILRYIRSDREQRQSFDQSFFPFCTSPRNMKDEFKKEIIILSLTKDYPVSDSTPYLCDGGEKYHLFSTNKKIEVQGVGFLGPISGVPWYDVTVCIKQFHADGSEGRSRTVQKGFSAEQGKIFRVKFNHPITLDVGAVEGNWTTHYGIFFTLKGGDTKRSLRKFGDHAVLHDTKNNAIRFQWFSNQLAELLYTIPK